MIKSKRLHISNLNESNLSLYIYIYREFFYLENQLAILVLDVIMCVGLDQMVKEEEEEETDKRSEKKKQVATE